MSINLNLKNQNLSINNIIQMLKINKKKIILLSFDLWNNNNILNCKNLKKKLFVN